MADTSRSLSDILTLMADNTTGAISAQDLRDLIVSLSPAFGGLYISSSAETSIATIDTWTLAAGTSTETSSSSAFTVSAANRLTAVMMGENLAMAPQRR